MSYGGADIIFPHLNIVIEHIRNHFTVFGFSVSFYGIIIGVGMILALLWAARNLKNHGEDPELIYDLFIVVVFFGLIGARAYYVIFNWDAYAGDILKIINVREGGLAIYGGVIGGLTSGIIFCRRKGYPVIKLMDACMPGVILAQGIGRWGNFFNCEAFGEYTDSLFAMRLKLSLVNKNMISSSQLSHLIEDAGYSYIQVHPTFLYESIWDIAGFLFLCRYSRRHDLSTGGATLLYFIWYGTGRFFIEGLRTDQLLIPGSVIPISQLLSFLLVVSSLIVTLYLRNRRKGA